MVYKIIFILIVFLNIQGAIAQINISFENDCLKKNSVLFSQFLIESKGEDFVSELLENNNSLVLFCDVDSLGHVVQIKKIREKKELNDSLKDEIISSLLLSRITFSICCEKPIGLSKCEAYKLLSKELFNKEKTTHLINVGFPGDIMALYQYEKSRVEEKGGKLSKLQYLLDYINKNQ